MWGVDGVVCVVWCATLAQQLAQVHAWDARVIGTVHDAGEGRACKHAVHELHTGPSHCLLDSCPPACIAASSQSPDQVSGAELVGFAQWSQRWF